MREGQNPIRLNDRPLPEGHDEERLRLARRLEIYRDPEHLMHALPVELFDLFRGNSLILAFSDKSKGTSWLAIDNKKDPIAPTPKGLDAQKSLHAWIEERRKPFILSSLTKQNPFRGLTQAFGGCAINCFFALITDYVALALDDRLVHSHLEGERTNLRLILDLNNSVVANLKLRDVLQSLP